MKYLCAVMVAALILGPTTLMAQLKEWKRIPGIMRGGQDTKIFTNCRGSDAIAPQLFFRPESEQPIDILARKSNSMTTGAGRKLIFEGKVRVKRGEVTLTCDKLIMLYDEPKGLIVGGIKSIECLCER